MEHKREVVGFGLVLLILAILASVISVYHVHPAKANTPSECVSYLTVSRDMHEYAILWRHNDGGERTHELWWRIYQDTSYQLWLDTYNPDTWDKEWIRRYEVCLEELKHE